MPLRSTLSTPACIAFIKQWRGLSLEKYQKKKGIGVIAYGHKITANESFDTPITVMQAETLLLADMRICEAFIHKEMTQIKDRFQLEALITWIFSVGITQFCAKNIWPVFISQPEIF